MLCPMPSGRGVRHTKLRGGRGVGVRGGEGRCSSRSVQWQARPRGPRVTSAWGEPPHNGGTRAPPGGGVGVGGWRGALCRGGGGGGLFVHTHTHSGGEQHKCVLVLVVVVLPRTPAPVPHVHAVPQHRRSVKHTATQHAPLCPPRKVVTAARAEPVAFAPGRAAAAPAAAAARVAATAAARVATAAALGLLHAGSGRLGGGEGVRWCGASAGRCGRASPPQLTPSSRCPWSGAGTSNPPVGAVLVCSSPSAMVRGVGGLGMGRERGVRWGEETWRWRAFSHVLCACPRRLRWGRSQRGEVGRCSVCALQHMRLRPSPAAERP